MATRENVATFLLLLTMGVALNEAREDYTMIGMYAVGLLHGALLFAILSRGEEAQQHSRPPPAKAAEAPPAKITSSMPPAAQITMTVDKFESLRAGRKEPAVHTPTSSRRQSLRTPKQATRLGDWSE